MKDYFRGLFDSYTRIARLYPALLSIAPIIWTTLAVASSALTENAIHIGASVMVSFGGIALLTSLARSLGKRVEAALLAEWGAWPTTQFLRHRDATIEPFTKARYHAKLQVICPDLSLPTKEDEQADPRRADDVYRSATMRLLEQRRGPEYKLLQGENAQYGFRRNLLGLRPVAFFSVGSSTLATAVVWLYPFTAEQTGPGLVAAGLADACYLLTVALVVRKAFVRQAADEYALSLLRTLEQDGVAEVNSGSVARA